MADSWQFLLKFIGKVAEEIMPQGFGYALKQGDVEVVLAENPVHMRARAANVVGQLGGRRALLPHHLFYMLPDVHEKAWNLFNLPNHRVSTPTISTSPSTPIKKWRSVTALDMVPRGEAMWKMMVQEFVFEMLS